MKRMHQLRPASSVRSTSSSGMCLEIGAMRSAGDLFKRAPTASSSFSTLAAPMVRINSSSSSALSNRPLGFQPNNSSSTSTIINREVSPCKLACQDHSSQLTALQLPVIIIQPFSIVTFVFSSISTITYLYDESRSTSPLFISWYTCLVVHPISKPSWNGYYIELNCN